MADLSAGQVADDQTLWENEMSKFQGNESLRYAIGIRISFIEMSFRDNAADPPVVTADVIRNVEVEGATDAKKPWESHGTSSGAKRHTRMSADLHLVERPW